MKTQRVKFHHPIRTGKDLPAQLEIRCGRLVTTTGAVPIFDIPDGTIVNVVDHEAAVKFVDEAFMWRHNAA